MAALRFEARPLQPLPRDAPGVCALEDGSLLRVAGMGAENAARAARELIDAGAGSLLSWGVAGALAPGLGCGTAIVPETVLRAGGPGGAPAQRFATSRRWRERLQAALEGRCPVVSGALLSSTLPVATASDKARLHAETGALAVDMESAAVAAVAAAHALPFAVLRVILDTAQDCLPESLMRAYAREPAVPAALLLAPQDWPGLLRLAWRYGRARRGLSACARLASDARRCGSAA